MHAAARALPMSWVACTCAHIHPHGDQRQRRWRKQMSHLHEALHKGAELELSH